MTHHLIIGGGPAAINAIETIRQYDGGKSQITLVSDEPAYARMVLPYYLAERIPLKQVFTGDAGYYDRLRVDRHIGHKVVGIDPGRKQVKLDDGRSLAFDNLLIATGSSPTVPRIPGIDLPGVSPMWTLSHTQAVLQSAAGISKPEVVFLGAGFIGFIVLNAMSKRGWKLHVVEMADQVLPRMLDADSARLVQAWLENKGVTFHLGTTASQITAVNGRKRVALANGQQLDADVVVVATGIRPNVDLVAGTGIETDVGILVNDRMQTNVAGIYAAGEVAQGPDLLGERPAIHAIQPTAVDHGRVAGANMAGQDVRYPGSLSMNILDAAGLQCASFGRWSDPQAETMTVCNPDRPVYRKLLWSGDRVTGAIFIGQASDVGMLTDLGMVKGIIQTQTPLGTWKEYIRDNPFDIRRPYIATKVGHKLAATMLLGQPAQPRQYRFDNLQPRPAATRPDAHQAFVGLKGS